MVFPFSTVKVASLKGNKPGFGDPGAREMRVFGALLIISTIIKTEKEVKKKNMSTEAFYKQTVQYAL